MKLDLISALVFCTSAIAQSSAPPPILPVTNLTTLPTYIAAGASFNQLGTPRFNFWLSGIVPISNSIGMYEATTVDLLPIEKVDSVTGRKVFTLQSTLREGVHKTLHVDPKNMVMIGGDAGLAFSQSSTTGASTTVNLSASFAVTYVRQINDHFAVIVSIRGVWVPTIGGTGAWNFIPEVGLTWKP